MDHNITGILDIPIEILEKIFTQLEATDILSCTKVCKQFWLASKRKIIWQQICRRFCDRSTYVIDYVNTVPSTVKPVYSPPQEVQASVCEWRRAYMRLTQLKRNCINGVYNGQFVTDYPVDTNISTRVFHDLLIVYNSQSNKVQVWNVRTEPRLVGTIVCALTNIETKLFMVGDNIAIFQGTVVQGFKVNVESGDIIPMYRRLVNGSNNSYVPEAENIDRWYMNRTQQSPQWFSKCFTGEYLICVTNLNNKFILYQWNVKTGQKVYELNIFSNLQLCSLSSPITYSGDILVVLFSNTTNLFISDIYRYNLESHVYTHLLNVSTRYLPSIGYENNTLIVFEENSLSNKLTLHNLPPRSVDLPAQISIYFGERVLIRRCILFRNILTYVLGQTLLIKNYSLNDIYHISLRRNTENYIPTYRLCDWNIVLVSFVDRSQKTSVIELHDYIAKCCIKTFDINGILPRKWSCVNIILEQKADDRRYVKLLKFW